MRKFKHKPTGEIATLHNNYYVCKDSACIPIRFIEASCDWEEVVEKEYEILSLITNNCFGITTSKIDIRAFMDSNPLTVNYKIHSVKRLSDGEIFTIGDDVIFELGKGRCHYKHFRSDKCAIDIATKIVSFVIQEDTLTVQIDYNKLCYSLDAPEKVKKPLFTTEDGVDIFEGDAIFGINAYGEVFSHCSGLPNKIMNWGKNPIFSTQVLAERYIELNSPKYTALDMLKVANHYAYIKDVTEDKILKYLAKNGI